jgi:tripartite-type tricarboxylate transporter receptor subunit TctC
MPWCSTPRGQPEPDPQTCPTTRSKDLAPVILLGHAPHVIATPAASDYKTFADVVAAARRRRT